MEEESIVNSNDCSTRKSMFGVEFGIFGHGRSNETYDAANAYDNDHDHESIGDQNQEDDEFNTDCEIQQALDPKESTKTKRSGQREKQKRVCILLTLVTFSLVLVITVLKTTRLPFRLSKSTLSTNYFVASQAIFDTKWDSYRIPPFDEHDYSEDGYDMLTELREAIAYSGMNLFKFKLSSKTCSSYQLMCANDSSSGYTLRDLAQEAEIVNTLSDDRFSWYHMWVYSFNLPNPLKTDIDDDVLEAEYQEMYDLTMYLLETYAGSGKTFFLGNWEGDWELLWASGCKTDGGFDKSCYPSSEIVDRYIAWSTARQKAVDDARSAMAGAADVHVYHYIEFNFEQENYEDNDGGVRPTILNSVVPLVNPDFLSYSAYMSTNRYVDHNGKWFNQDNVDGLFWEVLDYAESQLSDKTDVDFSKVSGRRVFIGEFGPSQNINATLARTTAAQVIRASLEWGCPFILQWEIYENDSIAMPLIPRETENMYTDFTPLRKLFVEWGNDAREYVKSYNPSSDDLRLFAIEWFGRMQ